MAKKKNEEPIYDHKHPYIPAGMTEVAGMPIRWLEPGEYADMSMHPNSEGVDVYRKEYHGKLVIGQTNGSATPMGANYFSEDGTMCEYVGDSFFRKMVEMGQRIVVAEKIAEDELDKRVGLQKTIDCLKVENEELNESCEKLQEAAESVMAELERRNEPEDVDSGTNNLHAAIGGQPKKVEITW